MLSFLQFRCNSRGRKKSGKEIIKFLDAIARQYSSELFTTPSYSGSSASSVMSHGEKVDRKHDPFYHCTKCRSTHSTKQARGSTITEHLVEALQANKIQSYFSPYSSGIQPNSIFIFCHSLWQQQFRKLREGGGDREREIEWEKKMNKTSESLVRQVSQVVQDHSNNEGRVQKVQKGSEITQIKIKTYYNSIPQIVCLGFQNIFKTDSIKYLLDSKEPNLNIMSQNS